MSQDTSDSQNLLTGGVRKICAWAGCRCGGLDPLDKYKRSYFEQLRTQFRLLPAAATVEPAEQMRARELGEAILQKHENPPAPPAAPPQLTWDEIYRLEVLIIALAPDEQLKERANNLLVEYLEVAGAERLTRQLAARGITDQAAFFAADDHAAMRAAMLQLQAELHYLYVTNEAQEAARQRAYLFFGRLILVLASVGFLLAWWGTYKTHRLAQMAVVALVGALAGCISKLQRLTTLRSDLNPIVSMQQIQALSGAVIPSVMIGCVAACVVYLLCAAGLMEGTLFPTFEFPVQKPTDSAVRTLFVTGTSSPAQFAKALFWAFIAGFSERFFQETVNRFDSAANPAEKK